MPERRFEDPGLVAPARAEVAPRHGPNRPEAARYVGLSTTTFDKLIREGSMPQPFRIGSRVIWDIWKLDAAFDVLSGPEEGTGWEDWDDPKTRVIIL